jgi:hypothetical protein
MELGSDLEQTKKKPTALILVIVGMLVLGVGAVVAFMKMGGNGKETGAGATATTQSGAQKWCTLRIEWAKKVSSLDADIMLKSVNPKDAAEKKKLTAKRDTLCAGFAQKLQKLTITDQAIADAEKALVLEGKVRANVVVQIANRLTKLGEKNPATLRAHRKWLAEILVKRINKAKSDADGPFAKATKPCTAAVYRGPITAAGTSSSPYVTWQEVEMQRKNAIAKFDEKIKEFEPLEQYANQVYHSLVSKYRKTLKRCYAKRKRRRPKISSKMQLLVRLKANGKVKSMGIVSMKVPDEKLLDCILNKAVRWTLPQPIKGGDAVTVKLDFANL